VELSAIAIYPIKGARAVPLDAAEVVERGLQHDRRFMIVSDVGVAITQREIPELALLGATIETSSLVLGVPSGHRLEVPLVPTGARRSVTVWSSEVSAIDVPEAHHFVSALLKTEAHLVYMPDDARRATKNQQALVSFADAYPFLLTSESSLAELNAHMTTPVPMDRFRPNLVVRGAPAWEEDRWASIRIGAIEFDFPKPCDRCVVTTVDQRTAQKGKEPLATLARLRSRDNKVWFGENLVHRGMGTLRVGDLLVPQALDG
jgi:uncharacterized protein